MKRPLTEKEIIRGFELAYLLYPDKNKALEICSSAFLQLQIEQRKEQRAVREKLKTLKQIFKLDSDYNNQSFPRIHFSDFRVCQKLIFQVANEIEREQENTEVVSQKLLTIRYLKYLVMVSLDHNILFLITGFSRVLHNYSTNETIKVCLSLYPGYSYKHLDRQIKKAKATLLEHLQDRFHNYVKVVDNRLQSITATNLATVQVMTDLINNSLNQLVLWDTECLTDLSIFNNLQPYDIILIGQQMSHLIIHPNCYTYLTDELQLNKPDTRLEIPKFFVANHRIDDENDPFDPPDFTEDVPKVLEAVKQHFDEVKQCRPNQLAIYIDYKKRGLINLHQTNKFFLKLVNEGRQLEIYDEESNLFLISHRLISDIFLEEPETTIVTIPIDNGQKFKLIIKYIPPVDDGEDFDEDNYQKIDTGTFEISISCHETSLTRALYWSYRRLLYEFDFSPLVVLSRFAITSMLLIILGVLAIYPNKIFNLDNQQTIVKILPTPIIKQTPKPNVTPLPEPQKQNIAPHQPNKINKPHKLQETPKSQPQVTEQEPNEIAMVERGDNATLATIKNIYISDLIDSDLKQALTESLQANGFNVVKSLAGSSIDGSLEYSFSEDNVIALSIKNKQVWKKSIDQPSPKEQAQAIILSLMEAIEKDKKDNKSK